MYRVLARLAALALLFASSGASAQTPSPPSAAKDPNATLVDELVVNAKTPGPAWWRVSKSDANVFILGLPTFAPSDLTFDQTLLRLRLDGADRLILAPAPQVNWLRLTGFLLGGGRDFRQSPPLSQSLPPAMVERLRRVLEARGQRLQDVDNIKPAFVSFSLVNGESRGSGNGATTSTAVGTLQGQIEKLARSPAIKARPRLVGTGGYDFLLELNALATLPNDAQIACLDDGLRTLERGDAGVREVATRWANGQVRELVSGDRGFEACLSSSPVVAKIIRRGMTASAAAIADALQRPGLSVALVDLRPLLAQDGVLDQLRREGYEVSTPGN